MLTCDGCDVMLSYELLTCGSSWPATALSKVSKTKRYKKCLHNVHLESWKIILFVNHWLSKNWNHSTGKVSFGFINFMGCLDTGTHPKGGS